MNKEKEKKPKIEAQLQMVAKALNCKFSLKGQIIAAERVLAVDGLLPSIMRRADQLCSFCLGYGLGVTFDRSETTMTGTTVAFDKDAPAALRLLCATDVLVELIQAAPTKDVTPVDELMLD